MLVGLIGSGRVGGTLARLLIDHGHEVLVANRRGPGTLADVVSALGPAATAAEVSDVGTTADLVVLAMRFHAYLSLRTEPLAGIVVVDATNYFPDRDGHLPSLSSGRSTSSELIAAHLTGAKLVKALNTMHYGSLATMGRPPGDMRRLAVPVA